MRRGAAGAVLVVAAAACQRPVSPPVTRPTAGPPERGMDQRLVRLPVSGDPTVTIEIAFPVGAQDDPPGKEGLAWVTAELLEAGSTTALRYDEILERLYPLATSYALRADREMTVISGRCHRDALDAFVPLFLDAFLHPAFNEADFQRVRADTLNYLEKTLRFASDEELGKAALNAFVFEGTRYAHPLQGTVEALRALTVEDVRAFHRRHYTREAIVAVGGGFDAALEARLLAAVDGLPPRQAATVAAPRAAPIRGREVLLVAKPGTSASISLGFPIAVRRGDRDYYALWVANSWLGEHRHQAGRLFQVIREQRGLNYGNYSYIEAYPDGGRRSTPPTHVGRRQQLFEVWIRTLPDVQAVFALRAALAEVDDLATRGLTREQFEHQRDFLRKYVLHFAETTAERLAYAVDDRYYGLGSEGHLARFQRALSELTLEEVNAAVRRHLRPERVKIAIVTGDAAGLAAALASGAPSPIEYQTPKDASILEQDRRLAAWPLGIEAGAIRTLPVAEIFER